MRNSSMLLLAALCVMVLGASGTAGEKDAWFDEQNCEFCTAWSANPELKDNLTWDMAETSDGILSVVSADADHAEAFDKANSNYDVALEKLAYMQKKGEDQKLCGSCSTLASFFPRGVKLHHMNAGTSHIMLLTSKNKGLVAELHSWVQQNEKELAKMELTRNDE